MSAPTDQWQWDAETGEVVALDLKGNRDGEAEPLDFTDEPVGVLAAAAPDMARALLPIVERGEECLASLPGKRSIDDLAAMETTITIPATALRVALAALRKAGVLP